MKRRIGLLGGSFDPPHLAHVRLAQLFADTLGLSELRVLPVGSPWQKHGLHAQREDRIRMLELAFDDTGLHYRIDQRELDRHGPSYSVDSLREIRAEEGPLDCIIFLLGADQLLGLPSWHGWPGILDLANFGVAGRPGSQLQPEQWPDMLRHEVMPRLVVPAALAKPAGQVALVPADLGDISSTRVRELLLKRQYPALVDLLPSKVLEFIRARGLYLS